MIKSEVENLTIVIQAGGESKRMGSNKSLMTFLGAPLVMRGINRLFPFCSEMLITSNEPERMGFLDSHVATGRLRIVADDTDARGALVGMRTAFANATNPFVGLVACDMVFPSSSLILHLKKRLEAEGADVAIPRTSHGYEPFHAVYRRESCLAAVEAAMAAGERRATSWLAQIKAIEVGEDEILRAHPRGGAFVNVNTPEELRDLERRILLGEITSADNEEG